MMAEKGDDYGDREEDNEAETERVIMAVEEEDEGDREDKNDDGRETERRWRWQTRRS